MPTDQQEEPSTQRRAEPAGKPPDRPGAEGELKRGGMGWYFIIAVGLVIVLAILALFGIVSLRGRQSGAERG